MRQCDQPRYLCGVVDIVVTDIQFLDGEKSLNTAEGTDTVASQVQSVKSRQVSMALHKNDSSGRLAWTGQAVNCKLRALSLSYFQISRGLEAKSD